MTTTMLELADGTVTWIDTEDIKRVSAYDWRLPSARSRYAVGTHPEGGCSEPVFLHRLIANAGPDDIVIHRNRNTLDNRRENLVVMGRTSLPLHPPTEPLFVVTAD